MKPALTFPGLWGKVKAVNGGRAASMDKRGKGGAR